MHNRLKNNIKYLFMFFVLSYRVPGRRAWLATTPHPVPAALLFPHEKFPT
jgi:hypothetical protein